METPELERFMFSSDKDAEGTSCCIQIACDPSIDQQTTRWGTSAFFRYGGEPKPANGQPNQTMSSVPPHLGLNGPNLTGFFSPIQSRASLMTTNFKLVIACYLFPVK